MKITRICVLAASSIALAVAAHAGPPGGEVVYLPMDGSLHDAVSGIPPVYAEGFTTAEGKFASAVHFDGNGSAELPIDINPDVMPSLTVSMWIKIDPMPENPDDIGQINTNGILLSGGGLEISVANARKKRPLIASTQWTGKHLGIRDYWTHVAVTKRIEDRDTPNGPAPHTIKTVYVNGVSHEYVNAGVGGGSRSIFIGNLDQNASSAYRGAIDELRIFPRVLTSDDIDQLRQESPQMQTDAEIETGDAPPAGGYPTKGTPDKSMQTTPVESLEADAPVIEEGLTEEQYEMMSRKAAERELARRADDAAANESAAAETNKRVHDAIEGEVDGGDPLVDSPLERRAREAEEQRRKADAAKTVGPKTPGAGVVIGHDTASDDAGAVATAPISGANRTAASVPRDDNAVINTNAPSANTKGDPDARIDEETVKELAFADWRIVGRERIPEDVRAAMVPGAEITINVRIKKNDPENKIPEVRLVFYPRHAGAEEIILPLRVMTSKVKPEATRIIPVTFTVPEGLDFDGESGVLWKPLVQLVPAERGDHHLNDSDPDNHRRELPLRVHNPTVAAECPQHRENSDGTVTTQDCLRLLFEGVAPPIPASPDDVTELGGGFVATAVSGDGGDNVDTVLVDFVFTDSFYTLERKDKPCALVVGEKTVGPCRDGGNVSPKLVFGLSTPQSHFDTPETAVVGLQLCQRSANDRVKGARIIWKPRNSEGGLSIEERTTKTFERPNCNSWQSIIRCQQGKEAHGVRPHWRNGSGVAPMSFLVGAQLICGPLRDN